MNGRLTRDLGKAFIVTKESFRRPKNVTGYTLSRERGQVTTKNAKRRLASGISTVAIAAALCVAQPAYAQAEYGTIQGHIDGAKAGAQVVAVDMALNRAVLGLRI